jgi:hypothetical protein
MHLAACPKEKSLANHPHSAMTCQAKHIPSILGCGVVVVDVGQAAVPHCSILGDCPCSGHSPPFASGVLTVNVCDRWPPPHVTEHAVQSLHVPTQFVAAALMDA